MARTTAVEVPGEEGAPTGADDTGTDEGGQQETTQRAAAPAAPAQPTRKPAPKAAAVKSSDLPDQEDIDPAKIPYGQTVMTKQGAVCSTQEDPTRANRPR